MQMFGNARESIKEQYMTHFIIFLTSKAKTMCKTSLVLVHGLVYSSKIKKKNEKKLSVFSGIQVHTAIRGPFDCCLFKR